MVLNVEIEVKIAADSEVNESFSLDANASREQVIKGLLDSGVWPFIRQKPFDTIANPSDNPKAIFISTFDTAPLAPDNDFFYMD